MTRIEENFEIEFEGKKYEIFHKGIKSYKEQKDFINALTEEIKATSVPHKNIFGIKKEGQTKGFIAYNNFECSVEWNLIKEKESA